MFSSSLPGASVTFLSSSPTSNFRGAQSSRSPTSLHRDPTPACSVCSHCWTLFNSYCLEDREFLKVALLIKWLLLKSLLSIVCLLICVNSCLDQWTWDAVLIIHFFFYRMEINYCAWDSKHIWQQCRLDRPPCQDFGDSDSEVICCFAKPRPPKGSKIEELKN